MEIGVNPRFASDPRCAASCKWREMMDRKYVGKGGDGWRDMMIFCNECTYSRRSICMKRSM